MAKAPADRDVVTVEGGSLHGGAPFVVQRWTDRVKDGGLTLAGG